MSNPRVWVLVEEIPVRRMALELGPHYWFKTEEQARAFADDRRLLYPYMSRLAVVHFPFYGVYTDMDGYRHCGPMTIPSSCHKITVIRSEAEHIFTACQYNPSCIDDGGGMVDILWPAALQLYQ